MKRFSIILLTALLVSLTLDARVGETIEQCFKRYGKPVLVKEEGKMYEFRKAGYIVQIVFQDGKAAMLMLTKTNKDSLGFPEEISETEIRTLLELNANNSTWGEPSYMKVGVKRWLTEDGSRVAAYHELNGHLLAIISYDFVAGLRKKAEEKKVENLEGF